MTLLEKLRDDCRRLGYTNYQLEYVTKIVKDYNPEYVRKYELGEAFRNSNQESSGLENQTFQEMKESVFDRTEEMAERALPDNQLLRLSPAEMEEVIRNEIDMRKSRKTNDNDRIKHLEELADKQGIVLEEKVTKERPPEKFWGQSATYDLVQKVANYHYILGDQFTDLARQIEQFKPTSETQKKAIPELEKYIKEELIPYTKLAIASCKGTETILRNITDEKYTGTKSGWMKIAYDKFMESGNHGSGEVNAVLTGIYVMKLGKYNIKDEDGKVIKTIDCIIRTPVERETTREQVGDKAIFEIESEQFVTCPQCNLEFNKPAIADEERDLIAGDMFGESRKILIHNGVSNFIDYTANNVITEEIKSPEQFFKEAMKKKYNKEVTDQELKNLKVVENTAEKIKAVDIDPESINRIDHSILNNGARRKHEKAEEFSKKA